MGIFDSLYVPCPKCGKEAEFQSKAGECSMECYTPANVPPEIAGDCHGDYAECSACGTPFELRVAVAVSVVTVEKRPDPEPTPPPPPIPIGVETLRQVRCRWQQWGLWPFSGISYQAPQPTAIKFAFWWWATRRVLPLNIPSVDERAAELAAWRDWILAQRGWEEQEPELVEILAETELLFRAHFPELCLPVTPGRVTGPLFEEATPISSLGSADSMETGS